MCGIAGLVRFDGLTPAERGVGARMARTLRHRGPDGLGAYEDACASLGHTRLSILDLDHGHQPMANEDGTVWVTFNGEIHNHLELAEELRAGGHVLRTRCDTEVLVHLYEDHGEAFVERLNGMFAAALWDVRRHRLVLIRDRLGIKPLYWHDDGRRIVFGSELKALLVPGDLSREVCPAALQDFLTFGHVQSPRTIYRGVRQLEPGELLCRTAGGACRRHYWDLAPGQPASEGSAAEESRRIDRFGELLEDAVGLRMIADVPLGVFLSGGVDSAAVTAAMCRRADGPVLTRTVGFDETDHDERRAAADLAGRLGTDHREIVVRADAAGALEVLAGCFDEPFADPCAVPMYHLAAAARQSVTVALSGDGGDELLAGYRRYRFDLAESRLRRVLPGWLRSTAGGVGRCWPSGGRLPRALRAGRTLENLARDDITAHLRSAAILGGILPEAVLRPEWRRAGAADPWEKGRACFGRAAGATLLNRLLYVDIKTLMVDGILTKVDRASMAVGLEVRPPLLDHRLVELCAGMPDDLKLRRGRGKILLRRLLARWLGESVAARPKRGFDVPVDAWLRGPLRPMVGDLLLAADARCREWLEPRAVARLAGEHARGRRSYGLPLWALLNLELWARRAARREHTSAGGATANREGRESLACAC